MRKNLIFLFVVFFSIFLTSCGVNPNKGTYPGYGKIPENFVMGEYVIEEEVNLTCIAHNDNNYYEAWTEIVHEYHGVFNYYNNFYPLKTNNRLTINGPKGIDFEVSLLNEQKEVVYTSHPDSFGVCYLFPNWYNDSYNILVKYINKDTLEEVVTEYNIYREITLNIKAVKVEKEIIDLMFVVDTTASMTEELDYLKNEINNVIEDVASINSCIVNVAVLLYKDKGEVYETLYSDFTTNVNDQVEFLSNKIAYGGGDYEEAVDVAINEAYNKSWSSVPSTKILVHIGDAPAHDENISEWYNAMLNLCGKGVQLITVASSGINKKTEYLFRSMTLISNGYYVALTNDSGVEGDYMDPTIDLELTIEYLDDCLVRLINVFHNGIYYDPIPIEK